MNVLVVGGGLLGRRVAELLDSAGHDVAVIDAKEENLAQLSPDFSGVTSVGFPMDIRNLKAAGIESCDAVAVTTADDNLNITVGQIAKDVFHIPKVVSRISDPYRENVFESLGLQTVCPTNMAGEKIMSALTDPVKSQQTTFGTTTITFSVRPVEKKQIGQFFSQIQRDSMPGMFAVIKADGTFQLQSEQNDIQLSSGDFLVFGKKID